MNNAGTLATSQQGLAGVLLRFWRDKVAVRMDARERKLQVLETLTLGGRKQLFLVSCAGERFLVGTGADAIHTLVKVNGATVSEESQ